MTTREMAQRAKHDFIALQALPHETKNAALGAIADALLRLETDAAFRARQVAYGLDRVKQFSWEKTARHLLALYESLGKTN